MTISRKEKKLETELHELYLALRVDGLAEAKKKQPLYCIQEKEADIQELRLHKEGQQERATVSLKEKKKLKAELQELSFALRADRLAEAGDTGFDFLKTKNGAELNNEAEKEEPEETGDMALNFSKTKVLEVRDEAKLNAIGPSARNERTGRVCVRQSRVEHGAVGSNTKLLMCEVNKFEAELQERFFTLRVDRLISKTKFEAKLNYNNKIKHKGEQRQDFSMFDHNSGINYSNAIR